MKYRYVENAPIAWHVPLRLAEDGWLARKAPELRRAARMIHGQLAGRLLCFRIVDTHVHLLLAGDRADLGRRVRALESALKQTLHTLPFEPARFRPVVMQRHLTSAMSYVLRQETRHNVNLDPAHDGSILPDLLGLRVLETNVVPLVRTYSPRLEASMVKGWGGVEAFEQLEPDPRHLAEAAAAAVALPHL